MFTYDSGDKLWVCRVDAASPHGRHAFVHGCSARKFIERPVDVGAQFVHEQLAARLTQPVSKIFMRPP